MHSYQIYNLHRIAINIVMARHISWYESYRDLANIRSPRNDIVWRKTGIWAYQKTEYFVYRW